MADTFEEIHSKICQAITNLESLNDDLRDAHIDTDNELEEVKTKLEKAEGRVSELEEEVDELKTEARDLEEQNRTLQRTLEEMD
jgi:chromosome segregation ATPase